MPSTETLREIERARAWIVFLLYASLIVYMSHQPGNLLYVPPFPHFDKLVHFIEYTVFALFFARALATTPLQGRKKRFFWVLFVGSALFATSDEFHQSFIPYRSCDMMDFATDCAGVLMGSILFRLLKPLQITRFNAS